MKEDSPQCITKSKKKYVFIMCNICFLLFLVTFWVFYRSNGHSKFETTNIRKLDRKISFISKCNNCEREKPSPSGDVQPPTVYVLYVPWDTTGSKRVADVPFVTNVIISIGKNVLSP